MATHVFTRHESYYSPQIGVVDFVIGQEVNLTEAISDATVRHHYLVNGALVPLKAKPPAPVESSRVAAPEQPVVLDEVPEVEDEPVVAAPEPSRGKPGPKPKASYQRS